MISSWLKNDPIIKENDAGPWSCFICYTVLLTQVVVHFSDMIL